MRKFLSLVLALVMMMSLVTINAGAKEFTDGDDIAYREAVDVISTIKVVDGYADGDFKPGNNLTRGAAAKIICNMILGPTTAAELHADTAPYRDVPVTSDFAGYIAYCQKEGIISGYADGSFRPAGTLTGYAFMKMLLGALGYDAEIEGYTGPNWSINVAKKAIGLGLNKSLEKTFNGVDFVTREEAALYAFNTLKADLVEYNQKITATVNGAEVVVGNSNAEPQKWESQQTRSDNIYRDGLVQFAEQYFNKLVLTEAEDVFGRPDREWRYDGDDIGAYINMDLFKEEYTTEVTGKQLRDLLGGSVVDDYSFTISVDGVECVTGNKDDLADAYFTEGNLIRTNTEKIGETGNGVLTQVFVNNDKNVEHVWISVINTYLAVATDDYSEKKEEVSFEVWSVDDVRNDKNNMVLVKDNTETEIMKVLNEDINVEDVKDGDIVLVHVADGAIQEIFDPEVIDETEISSFKEDSWVKADGEQYDYANSVQYDPEVLDAYDDYNMKDTTYRVFLDQYGYAIGVEIIEATAQYVFVTGIDKATHNLTNKTADGNIIHLDGTMETVKIDMKNSVAADGTSSLPVVSLLNTWCKYTVNANNVYTLTEIANDDNSFKRDDRGNPYTEEKTDKVGQGHDIDIADYNTADNNDDANETTADDFLILDKSHIYLSSVIPAYKTVYANDDTVFITAKVSEIKASEMYSTTPYTDWNAAESTGYVAAIDDVDSVTVGARNVNLKVWNAAKVWEEGLRNGDFVEDGNIAADGSAITDAELRKISSGAYTLFSDKGYVIATVVVGEDDGSTTNFAFVTSGNMKQEDYSKADDVYTWSREVIVNGELVDLIEKGDNRPAIKGMTKGNWYEVKYKGDGTVRSVLNLCNNTIDPSIGCPMEDFDGYLTDAAYDGSKYIQWIGDYEAAVEENDTVLLWDNLMDDEYGISVEGNTLQVETESGDKNGFSVSGNCKVVLIQDKVTTRGKVSYIDYVEEYSKTGTEGLKQMLKDLNDNAAFVGFVGAVFEGKLATSVVIYDKTETEVDVGGDVPSGSSVYVHTEENGDISITTHEVLSARQIANIVKAHLDDPDIDTVTYTTDGSAHITYTDGVTTTMNVVVTRVGSPAEVKGADLMNTVQDQINSTYGTITIEGNHMTATGADAGYLNPDEGEDGTSQATLDFVGFLVGLHGENAKVITFEGEKYTWNGDIRFASKWLKEGGTVEANGEPTTAAETLVTAVVTFIEEYMRDNSTTTADITLTVDGAEIIFTVAVGS